MKHVAMHDDQLHVDEDIARRLIHEQFPQWADLAVRLVPTAATVNAIFRLGSRWRLGFRSVRPIRTQ